MRKTPAPLVFDKDALSLSSSDDEEGQRTPLPGSTCHLDIANLPDEQPSDYELRVTVISSGQVRLKDMESRFLVYGILYS